MAQHFIILKQHLRTEFETIRQNKLNILMSFPWHKKWNFLMKIQRFCYAHFRISLLDVQTHCTGIFSSLNIFEVFIAVIFVRKRRGVLTDMCREFHMCGSYLAVTFGYISDDFTVEFWYCNISFNTFAKNLSKFCYCFAREHFARHI